MNNNLHFGVDSRFKMDAQKAQLPGPGTYKDEPNWVRRTYNLKFLNLTVKDRDNEYQNRSQSIPQNFGTSFNKSNFE